MIEQLGFAALLLVFAGPLGYAFGPGDLAAIRRWRQRWASWQAERRPRVWAPGELPRLARELAAERAWERRFWTARQRYEANRRLRLAGFSASLVGRAERLP